MNVTRYLQAPPRLIMSNKPYEPLNSEHNCGRDGRAPAIPVTILILWESFTTAAAAKTVCREMEKARNLRICRQSMWKFDLLQMPRLCEAAAREAAEADCVIVAFENNSAPSLELLQWLEFWRASASDKPQSLIALCLASTICERDGGLLHELRTFACRLGCTFYPSPGASDVGSGDERPL